MRKFLRNALTPVLIAIPTLALTSCQKKVWTSENYSRFSEAQERARASGVAVIKRTVTAPADFHGTKQFQLNGTWIVNGSGMQIKKGDTLEIASDGDSSDILLSISR